MKDKYTYNLSNGKTVFFENKGENFLWRVEHDGEIIEGEARTLGDAEDAAVAIALAEELKKLNDIVNKGLEGKPSKFFADPDDSDFVYFAIAEAMLDEHDDDSGLEEYSLHYYSIHIEHGSRDDKRSWNFGDGEYLGLGFQAAINKLKALMPKIRAKKHMYS